MADSPAQAEGLSAEDRGLVEAVLIELASDPCCPIERLARRVCLSPSRFAHRFREAAGLSPGAFAVAFRMQAAEELIVDVGCRSPRCDGSRLPEPRHLHQPVHGLGGGLAHPAAPPA